MTFLAARDHTALRHNLTRVVDMFNLAEISPADAVADVLHLCHANQGVDENQGLDTYVAKTLTLMDLGEVSVAWVIDHLVEIGMAKDPQHLLRPEFA